MFTYRLYQWIDGTRTEVAASGERWESAEACEVVAREELRKYLPGTICEIVESGESNLTDGRAVKRIGN